MTYPCVEFVFEEETTGMYTSFAPGRPPVDEWSDCSGTFFCFLEPFDPFNALCVGSEMDGTSNWFSPPLTIPRSINFDKNLLSSCESGDSSSISNRLWKTLLDF